MKIQIFPSSFFVILLIFFFSSSSFAQNQDKENSIQGIEYANYRHFTGKMDKKLSIAMDLKQDGNKCWGNYYYTTSNLPIHFKGKSNKNGDIELEILSDREKIIGHIIGKIKKNKFIGKWQNEDKTEQEPIYLVEDYSKSSAFSVISVKDTLKIIKNGEVESQAIFSDMVIDVTQVPKKSDLAKIKEIIKDKQKITSLQNAIQVIENNKFPFFKEYKQANEETVSSTWRNQRKVEVVFNDNYFTTLSFSHSEDTGGSHGAYNETYLVIDLKNSKQVK